MIWLFVSVFSYFILAIVSLIDKFVLKSLIPNPKVYAFYIGVFGILILFLVPFVGFSIPNSLEILLALSAGVFFIFGLLCLFTGLKKYETSRIIPAIGGLTPIFTFTFIFTTSKYFIDSIETFSFSTQQFLAFIVLVLGSFLISYEISKKITFKSFFISTLAAIFFSASYVLTKYVFLTQPFWNALIWIKTGSFLAAIFLIFTKEVRERVLMARQKVSKKALGVLVLNQGVLSVSSGLLLNWAIFLAPLSGVVIINALQGTQYVFLFVLALILSFKFPNFLKEEISKKIILQKSLAIFLIALGFIFLYLN